MLIDNSHLYTRYLVEIAIGERLHGGTPKDPKLIQAWVESTTGHDDELTAAQVAEHLPDIEAATEEVAKGMWCGFKSRAIEPGKEPMPYVETRQVKAMLRECATVLGITKKKRGSKQVIQHGFEVKGRHKEHPSCVFIFATERGSEERAIHVMTAQGPRSALKRSDWVGAGSALAFEVWILKTAPQETRHIGEKELTEMLALAQENGLGADRSQGMGKFEVVKFEKLSD